MRIQILFLLTLFLVFGCKKQTCEVPEDITNIQLDVTAKRFDKQLFAARSKADVANFVKENPVFADRYLQRKTYGSDSALVNSLYGMDTEPSLRQLAEEADKRFSDLPELENDMELAFK